MKQYAEMLEYILKNGEESTDRTGTGTLRVPSYNMKFQMKDGFPLVTGKKTFYKNAFNELFWMIKGKMDLRSLLQLGNNTWNEWAFKKWINSPKNSEIPKHLVYDGPSFPDDWEHKRFTDELFGNTYKEQMNNFKARILEDDEFSDYFGDYRPMYGYQWRHFPTVDWKTNEVFFIDQLANAIEEVKNHSNSRRIIVNAWNPGQIKDMELPPCHFCFQFLVINDKLHMSLTQRSCDTFLGVPFDIAAFALMLHMVANIAGLKPGELNYELHDTHIYLNHIDQVKEYLNRPKFTLPDIVFNRDLYHTDIESIKFEDIEIINYTSGDSIKAPIAI